MSTLTSTISSLLIPMGSMISVALITGLAVRSACFAKAKEQKEKSERYYGDQTKFYVEQIKTLSNEIKKLNERIKEKDDSIKNKEFLLNLKKGEEDPLRNGEEHY